MMRRKTALALLAGAGAALARPASAQGITFKAAGVPEESATPVLWGIQSGMFRHYGLAVTLEGQRSGTAIAAGVAGGAYQIGKSSIVPLIIAHAKGIPFVLVAPGGLYRSAAPHIGLLVAASSPIRTAAQLNGKTLGVSALDDLYTLGIKDWMDQNGGNSTTLKIVELPLSAVDGALLSGRIDAGGSAMPQMQQALDSGKERVLAYMFDAIAPEFMYTAWFSTVDQVRRNRKAFADFARAEREAATYVNAHHQQTIEILSKFTAIPGPVIAHMVRATMGTTLDPKLVQPCIDVCAKYGVIPKTFDAREMLASL